MTVKREAEAEERGGEPGLVQQSIPVVSEVQEEGKFQRLFTDLFVCPGTHTCPHSHM